MYESHGFACGNECAEGHIGLEKSVCIFRLPSGLRHSDLDGLLDQVYA